MISKRFRAVFQPLGELEMEEPTFHSSIIVLSLILTLTLFLGTARTVCANILSNVDNVVRLQGSDLARGGTGSLIGFVEHGSTLRMVFLSADHVPERLGPITTIGFGNVDDPIVNLDSSGASIYKKGPTGTEDITIYGIAVNLNDPSLTTEQKSFLRGLTPFSVAASPSLSSLPFEITDYGYGISNVSDSYGTQNSFSNLIKEYRDFTGSYTEDMYGNPLNYSQTLEVWIFDPDNKHGAGVRGFSGSPLIYNGEIQGIQVNGSRSIGGENWGLRFTDAEVLWINTQRDIFLAIPIPGGVWLFGSGLLGLAGWRRLRKG